MSAKRKCIRVEASNAVYRVSERMAEHVTKKEGINYIPKKKLKAILKAEVKQEEQNRIRMEQLKAIQKDKERKNKKYSEFLLNNQLNDKTVIKDFDGNVIGPKDM